MNRGSSDHAAALREQYFGHRHLTVIEPTRGWRMLDLRELWAYRELLWVLASRDVRVRYRQTILGAGWALLRPLLTMVIFTVIFGRLARIPSEGYPYPVWVFAGLVPWAFFSGAVAAAGQSLVGSSHLVSKVYFPRLIVPLSSIGAPLVDFLVSMLFLLFLVAWYDVGWTINLTAVPLLILSLILTALGIGTLLSALTVAYRDFTHVLPFLVQVWMYVTPVVYPASLVPQRWKMLLYLNPMSGVVEAFRSAFLGKQFNATGICISAGAALVLLVAGIAYFERVERRFADVI